MNYIESNTEMVMLSMWSNPSIEMTRPGKLGHATHAKRWASQASH
jgi:hypothetical protein